jgi:2-oxoglutarate ferredoxin oxidoreductase subunit alpha
VVPGTVGLEYRIGGLEKEDGTGTISHDARNHEKMVHLRAAKIAGVAQDIPPLEIFGNPDADLLVLGWGSTQGVIRQVVQKLNRQGIPVAATHLRHLNPLPADLLEVARRYKRVLLPEMNTGQLWYHLRGTLLLDCELLSKVQGQPFSPAEIEAKILSML